MKDVRTLLFVWMIFVALGFSKPRTILAEPAVVISMCESVQGNGLNWASSLAWLSETFRLRAAVAQKLEMKVLFNLNCATGSSSGAAVVGILSALLENESLIRGENGLYSPKEVVILSRALRFLAYTTDMTNFEFRDYVNIRKNDYGHSSWWGAQYQCDMVFNTFGRRMLIASRLKLADLDKTMLTTSQMNMLTFDDPHDIPDQSSPERKRELSLLLNSESDSARILGRAKIDGLKHHKIEKIDNEVRTYVDSRRAPVGLMTSVYGYVVSSPGYGALEKDHIEVGPPPFKDLRPVVFMSRPTLETVLKSKTYQHAIKNNTDKTLSDTVFVAVDSLYELLSPSIKEPFVCKSEKKLISQYGTTEYFDPKLALANKEKFGLESLRFDTTKFGGTSFDSYLINTGGWMNYSFGKKILAYYHLAKNESVDMTKGHTKIAYMNSFGKDGATIDFSHRVINDIFTRKSDGKRPNFVGEKLPYATYRNRRLRSGAAESIATFYYDTFHYDKVMVPFLATKKHLNIESTHVGLNWDIPQWKIFGKILIPGALIDKGRDLLMLSINHTRSQLSINIDREVKKINCKVRMDELCEMEAGLLPKKNSFGWHFDAHHVRDYNKFQPWPKWLLDLVTRIHERNK